MEPHVRHPRVDGHALNAICAPLSASMSHADRSARPSLHAWPDAHGTPDAESVNHLAFGYGGECQRYSLSTALPVYLHLWVYYMVWPGRMVALRWGARGQRNVVVSVASASPLLLSVRWVEYWGPVSNLRFSDNWYPRKVPQLVLLRTRPFPHFVALPFRFWKPAKFVIGFFCKSGICLQPMATNARDENNQSRLFSDPWNGSRSPLFMKFKRDFKNRCRCHVPP